MNSITINSLVIGHGFELKGFKFFFGNRNCDIETALNISGREIRFLQQCHSDRFVESSSTATSADGHWTSDKSVALGLHTADCLPLLIACPTSGRMAAVHAGWRGVKSQIVKKVVDHFCHTGSLRKELIIAIGPHIQEQSFEIERSLAFEILSQGGGGHDFHPLNHPDPAKCYLSLQAIVTKQLGQIPPDHIHRLNEDTFSNLEYFSFRREGRTNRLIHFIQFSP